jgi:GNAT superfamily N-acetyltransferase
MEITHSKSTSERLRFSIKENDKEIARAYLYIIKNDLHAEPYGFIEDVAVDSAHQGKGLGTQIIQELIKAAEEYKCYKIICTARNKEGRASVHDFYLKLGFREHGLSYRMDLSSVKSAY